MRVFNFSAGPAILPLPVLVRAQREMTSYQGSGMNVMEMSHRSPIYENILFSARDSLRRLMNISDDYEILFLQGGALHQFAMVPMNLMRTGKADYAKTGVFASKAMEEAEKYGDIHCVCSGEDHHYRVVPSISPKDIRPDADYLHITTNNTIYGTSCRNNLPDSGAVPLVADMSSNILGEVYDVNRFGLIYAGAQKNIGCAGLTIVIIRKNLLREPAIANTPATMRYDLAAKNDSMLNTPPTYAIYIAGLVFEYLESMGGVSEMQKNNEKKSTLLYQALDESKFYTAHAEKGSRSIMNVTFTCPSKTLDAQFVKEAEACSLINLKGHRMVGGIRASIYNAMPLEGVQALVEFMAKFESANT